MNGILMIAYHYPPIRVSSGLQRTLKFSTYLRDHGWQPAVLSVHPRAYEQVSGDQMDEIPDDVPVKRALAFDTARHLAPFGRYPHFMAVPDRWMSWIPGGVVSGWRMIRRYRPRVIWSTYPIATAHVVAYALHRISGLPWVADLRDPMAQDDYPKHPLQRRAFLWIERRIVRAAARIVVTTEGTRRMYLERYPEIRPDRIVVIPNGYDEENFTSAESGLPRQASPRLRLVHSGIIYPRERDPRALFQALSDLKARGEICAADLEIILRATGHDAFINRLTAEYGIEDLITIAPMAPYHEALSEMLSVDALILMQASNCNAQVPAKLFEYLRAQRPILALTDPAGDTAGILKSVGANDILPLDDSAAIAAGLMRLVGALRAGNASVVPLEVAARFSRTVLTARLAEVLDEVAGEQYRANRH